MYSGFLFMGAVSVRKIKCLPLGKERQFRHGVHAVNLLSKRGALPFPEGPAGRWP
jgi:hypothetical protein